MSTAGGGETRVSIPNSARKAIQQLNKTLRFKHTDQFLYTTLNDSHMDPTEASRRLKMIHDIREIAGKHSVEDVYTMLKECNLDANEAAQRLLYIDTFHMVKKKHDRKKTISNDVSQDNRQTRGNHWRGDKGGRGTFYQSKVFEDVGDWRNLSSGKEFGVTNRVERVSKPTLPGHMGKENNGVHVANSNANGTLAISNGSYNHKLASELPTAVASSAADHVVVSSQNTKYMCAVGTIKCEIVKSSGSGESNARMPAGMKFTADQLGVGTIPVIAEAADSDLNSTIAEKNQISESSQSLLLPTQNSSQAVNPIQDNHQPSQLLNEPLKGSVPEEECELTISAPKVDVMVEKLTSSSHQAVIFPDHIQVPENFKCQFVFGSLDATPGDCKPISVTESAHQNEVVKESSLSKENVSIMDQEVEIQEHVFEDASPSEDNGTPDSSAQTHEQANVEMIPPPPTTVFQNLPVFQATRDYYGYMPPMMSFVQLDVPELQNGNSQVVSAVAQPPVSVTQPAMAGQSSMALSPPMFPYFRPYPNYIPYNPYFPMYLPQTAHLLNHGVFPQPPPPTTNVQHMQAAAAEVKAPTPSQNTQGSNEDITTSETTDNCIISTVQQVEDSQARAHTPLHDLPNISPNYFYSFPQGQHMAAFSPLEAAALYHSSQTMTTQSTIPPPLMYQPPPASGMVEPTVQPSTSYHQHQHVPQVNRNDIALVKTGTA